MKRSQTKVGMKVIFTNPYDMRKGNETFFPIKGTKGIIVAVDRTTRTAVNEIKVQWEKGSTSRGDIWWTSAESLEVDA